MFRAPVSGKSEPVIRRQAASVLRCPNRRTRGPAPVFRRNNPKPNAIADISDVSPNGFKQADQPRDRPVGDNAV